MAYGSMIIVSSEPRGRFTEGIISGTPKPGTCMEIVPATEPVGGRFTYRVFSGASGAAQPVIVLLPDLLQGKLATDAYVTGTRGFLYAPANGEELNMLVADIAGTADNHAIGDVLMIQTATGKLIIDSSGARKPFICLETATAPTADALLLCQYTGD